ncbi:MAG: LexA family protein [Desulfuromonadaceae bacterium]
MKSYTPCDKGSFFLRVDGDSMIEDHILHGDLALIRPHATADNGDIVVALIDDEATLKRYYREGDHIRLEARNPAFESTILSADEEVSIIGKAIKIVRNIDCSNPGCQSEDLLPDGRLPSPETCSTLPSSPSQHFS